MDKMILLKKHIRVTADGDGLNVRVNGIAFANLSKFHTNIPGPVAIYCRKLKNIKLIIIDPSAKLKLGLRYEAGKKSADLHVVSDGVWVTQNEKYTTKIPFERRCIIL